MLVEFEPHDGEVVEDAGVVEHRAHPVRRSRLAACGFGHGGDDQRDRAVPRVCGLIGPQLGPGQALQCGDQ